MTPDRRIFLGGALALAACGRKAEETAPQPNGAPIPAASKAKASPVTDLASLKALLDAQLAATNVPALAAAVFNARDFVMESATGVRRAGAADAVTTRDLWHLGSGTKAMTAALYARLVEQGRAKWGATAAELFPDLAAELDPAFATATVEDFMRHRSGLADLDVIWATILRNDRRALPAVRTSVARQWLAKPPGFMPGTFSYSNVGYVVVGAAIERITQSTWEEALTEHVWKPLGITGAGFGPPQGAQPQGHRPGLLGAFTPMGEGPAADNAPAVGPAGTVHASFADWSKFVRVFLDPAQTFLSADSIARLTTPRAGETYALGWGVTTHPVGGRVLSHTGSNTMWMVEVAVQPEKGLASFIASNCGGDPAERAIEPVTMSLIEAIGRGQIV